VVKISSQPSLTGTPVEGAVAISLTPERGSGGRVRVIYFCVLAADARDARNGDIWQLQDALDVMANL
jgi:hypothetical protein